ncbi:hypothetical protein MSAN_02024700 [Mycena sanguinolenta]|uniref:Uncharacterized protein n=1 Tax=Mycena sanguinolenta TaxID=230812 RepID=A0A8H7CM01_9AGAR|nr:hypothetical protein MSAN_02024700 [Mycena sanguinolenta]
MLARRGVLEFSTTTAFASISAHPRGLLDHYRREPTRPTTASLPIPLEALRVRGELEPMAPPSFMRPQGTMSAVSLLPARAPAPGPTPRSSWGRLEGGRDWVGEEDPPREDVFGRGTRANVRQIITASFLVYPDLQMHIGASRSSFLSPLAPFLRFSPTTSSARPSRGCSAPLASSGKALTDGTNALVRDGGLPCYRAPKTHTRGLPPNPLLPRYLLPIPFLSPFRLLPFHRARQSRLLLPRSCLLFFGPQLADLALSAGPTSISPHAEGPVRPVSSAAKE